MFLINTYTLKHLKQGAPTTIPQGLGEHSSIQGFLKSYQSGVTWTTQEMGSFSYNLALRHVGVCKSQSVPWMTVATKLATVQLREQKCHMDIPTHAHYCQCHYIQLKLPSDIQG